MFGKLKLQEMDQLLRQQIVGRLGCHNQEDIYVVPISYAYDGEYIYAHSFEGLKLKLMRSNKKVCFQVDQMNNMANWKSVVVWGEFEELNDETSKIQALQTLENRMLPMISSETTHLSLIWPFPSNDVTTVKGIFFRIRVTEMTGRYEHNQDATYLLPD